ncbi:MAG: hypothetical protein QME94_07465 [Anaerolineae bacterium]|nr:hypothetical protein [Anaerolineae bacterium]
MLTWKSILVEQEHLEDLRRAAEKERLLLFARQGRVAAKRLCCSPLRWLGRKMVECGGWLEARYGAQTAPGELAGHGCAPRPR